MCIKVKQDEALRSKNLAHVGAVEVDADIHPGEIVESARAAAGAVAALLSTGSALIVQGALADSARELSAGIVTLAAKGEVGLRTSWGTKASAGVCALRLRLGLQSLALMQWADGAWLALVDAAPSLGSCQLKAIAESLHDRCVLHAQMREAKGLTQRLEDVARASGDWSWETDAQHRYTWVHGTVPTAAAPVPPTIGELIPSGLVVNWQGEPETPMRDFHAVLRQGEPIVRMVTREYWHGRSRYVSRSAVPLHHADGSLRGFRGSARDVTQSLEAKAQLWRRDKALRLAKERAEASSQAKSMLVSKVGHELRTPLNAIVGLAQLIQMRNGPADTATVEQWVAQIAKTGWHMVDVLDMLMELGKAGALDAAIRSKPVDLVEVVREAMHLVEREAKARAIGIALDGEAPVPAVVDRRAICQVVVNLLSNAIKYNREGGEVRVRVTQGEHTRIEIQDTGPGLTQMQVSRLFLPFERLGAESSNVAGHGLGLLICKELVAAMRGNLQVASTVGRGTTFTVCLPSPQAGAAGDAALQRARASA
ncbi:MAG TPA: PAS domain-containing sensor histidine kinase [Albitalea sp.]|uniref:sensor histidine kinase n=1 Tax=Piscinibacter sp. TaxID=1903157 RepID=UPI002ED3C229